MPLEDQAEQTHNPRTEIKHQDRQNQETRESSRKDRDEKMGKSHLEYCRAEHKNLEWHGRRKHPGKHQRPELMLLEGAMDPQEARLGYSLA